MLLPISCSLTYSPIWYSTNALDTLEWNHDEKSGIFYYGARNSIYFIKLNEITDNSKIIDDKSNKNVYYEGKLCYFFKAHHDYIVGVCTLINGAYISFKEEKKLAKFFSCGKDNMIRIWSYEDAIGCFCLKELNFGNTTITKNVTCISVNKQNVIVCGFEKGYLLSWNYKIENEWKIFTTENEDIVHIEWLDEKLAIAFKRGIVAIYVMNKYDSLSKVTRFRAHQSDTCNISWNPCTDNVETWGDLATSGKDHQIKLWRTDTNINLKTLKLPNVKRKDITDGTTSSSWSSICWSDIDHGALVISNSFGNLGIWSNLNSYELKCFPQNLHVKIHTKCVFGIKEFRNYRGLLVSHSLDRTINISRIMESGTVNGCLYSIPGLGGSVMALAGVEHNNQLAIGCGDNNIRLWKYDTCGRRSYDITNIWNGINGKVLSLCWHPYKENLLAFGTEDGQVGFINVSKEKKVAKNSQLHHKAKVFVVTWGLDMRHYCSSDEVHDNLIVYSIGNYSLYGHDFRRDEYFDASSYVSKGNSGISDFCVHRSLKYFAVGCNNGDVNIFSVRNMVIICTIKTHSKGINCMRWSPLENGDKLAIGSNERFLSVTDLGNIFNDFQQSITTTWITLEITETIAMLKGHGDRITCVDWCTFDDDKLVTGSYDNTSFVWSININGPLASFNSHQGKILCCHWSKRDADLIYTGGDDSNLFSWCLSQQSLKSKMNKRRQGHDIPGISLIGSQINKEVIKDETNKKNTDIEHGKSNKTVSNESISNLSKESINRIRIKKRHSLFPNTLFAIHHPLEEQQNSIIKFINNDTGYLSCFDIFSSRTIIMKQIDIELKLFLQDENYENYFILLIWTGKISQVIRECISLNYTSDWLMSIIFGFTSKGLPEELLRTLVSNTIANKKDPILAATYWLSLNQSVKAIELLINQKYIREAFILAKLRLSPDHPLVKTDIISKLQVLYFTNGNYELSAMCSLSLMDYKSFVETMNRRNSLLSNWVVIKAMNKCGQKEVLKFCVINLINLIMFDVFDKKNEEIIKEWINRIKIDSNLSHYSILIDLHQWIWLEQREIQDIAASIKRICSNYEINEILNLKTQIITKLLTKQINQVENQLALYITYELFIIIVTCIYNIDDNFLIIDSLKECLVQFIKINDDKILLNRLASINESDDHVMERLRIHLSKLI